MERDREIEFVTNNHHLSLASYFHSNFVAIFARYSLISIRRARLSAQAVSLYLTDHLQRHHQMSWLKANQWGSISLVAIVSFVYYSAQQDLLSLTLGSTLKLLKTYPLV